MADDVAVKLERQAETIRRLERELAAMEALAVQRQERIDDLLAARGESVGQSG